ncbi:hypothetical protein AAC387_Pa07g1409 [Persea americana]
MLKNRMELRGKDEQALRHYLESRTTPTSIETFLQDYASGMPTRFSYKQIKKYSNNFCHKLGQGGFGSVFKAELPNICTVAVKILDENEQSYAPPEMWWKSYGPVSEKSDVYSFGMVLLEMVGERRNFNDNMSRSSEIYFPEWVYSHHVVHRSNSGGSKWHKCEGEEEENITRRMELVGLWCIQYSPSRRPSMRNVINMLQGDVAIDIPPLPFKANVLHHADIKHNSTDNCDDVS